MRSGRRGRRPDSRRRRRRCVRARHRTTWQRSAHRSSMAGCSMSHRAPRADRPAQPVPRSRAGRSSSRSPIAPAHRRTVGSIIGSTRSWSSLPRIVRRCRFAASYSSTASRSRCCQRSQFGDDVRGRKQVVVGQDQLSGLSELGVRHAGWPTSDRLDRLDDRLTQIDQGLDGDRR